jgi:hypothetical protein
MASGYSPVYIPTLPSVPTTEPVAKEDDDDAKTEVPVAEWAPISQRVQPERMRLLKDILESANHPASDMVAESVRLFERPFGEPAYSASKGKRKEVAKPEEEEQDVATVGEQLESLKERIAKVNSSFGINESLRERFDRVKSSRDLNEYWPRVVGEYKHLLGEEPITSTSKGKEVVKPQEEEEEYVEEKSTSEILTQAEDKVKLLRERIFANFRQGGMREQRALPIPPIPQETETEVEAAPEPEQITVTVEIEKHFDEEPVAVKVEEEQVEAAIEAANEAAVDEAVEEVISAQEVEEAKAEMEEMYAKLEAEEAVEEVEDVVVKKEEEEVRLPSIQEAFPNFKTVSPAEESSVAVTLAPINPLRAAFVTDVTVPDGQVLPPGAEFMKSWRIKNDGTRAWPEGTVLQYVAGVDFDTSGPVKVEVAEVGQEVDVWTGELKAPETPGRYVGYWRLVDDNGRVFGHSIWIE